MAITGIDTIEGKQIIAAGAVSAKSAEMAYNDENGNPITGYQVAGDYYSASNPSGFITDVPDTYLQNTDLEISDNQITGISGIPLSAGGDVPEGVMVESGLEYNAVNEISAYNGSAIAQYGAEKQFIVHDDTLVHLSNSAQYALGVNLSAVAQLLGVDETVLWSGSPTTFTSAFTASESIANFDKIKVSQMIYTDNEYIQENHEYESDAALLTNEINVGFTYIIDNGWKCWGAEKYHITNGTNFTIHRAGRNFIGPNTTDGAGYNDTSNSQNGWIYKVVGIGRKA